MKAFILSFIIFFTLITTASPALAQTSDYPTSNTKTFTAPVTSPIPNPQATASGRIRLIPNTDGSYKVVPLDPNSAPQINQAGFCDIPVLGGTCDIPGIVWDNFTDCVTSPFRLDVKDLVYDCSGTSTAVDILKAPAEWGFNEIVTVASALMKLGVGIVGNAVTQMMVGCEFHPGETECWEEQAESVLNPNGPVKNAGAVMMLAQITGDVASLQIPLSTELYLANMNPFKDASADGLSDLTQPNKNRIFEIWKNARDAAYVLSIVILVIVGFLIMLRAKLDPKTAVNLTNSLPKIIAMLLLITFSLAISGLIIDLGRIVLQLMLSILPEIGLNDIGRMFLNTIWAVFLPIIVIVVIVGVATAGTGIAPVIAGGLIILLLLAIVIFIICTIILFKLVIRYAKFLLSAMFAPLIFLALPLPGGGKIVSDFLKRQVAYILTIPITVLLIELAWLIAGSCIPSPFAGGIAGAPNQVIGALANNCGGVPRAANNAYSPFELVPQVEAQTTTTPGPSFNPFGLFSMIAPFIGLGILAMATKADSIADDIMSIKPLGGHGGGGGRGHGGIMALLGLSAVGEGLDNVGDLMKLRGNVKNTLGNRAVEMAASGYGYTPTRLNPASGGRNILGDNYTQAQARAGILNDFGPKVARDDSGRLSIQQPKTKADFGPEQLAAIKDNFIKSGISEAQFNRSDLPELVNQVRTEAGFNPINARGEVQPRGRGGVARSAGRALGAEREQVMAKIAEDESTIIERNLNSFIRPVTPGPGQPTPPPRPSPLRRVGADYSPDEAGDDGDTWTRRDDDNPV